MRSLGLRLNLKRSMLSPVQTTTFLGVIWDSTTMRAFLSPTHVGSILSTLSKINLGLGIPSSLYEGLLGLMAAAANVIPLGLLHMRQFQWWLKSRGFHPRMKPPESNQCHAAMPTCPEYLEVPAVSSLGSHSRGVSLLQDGNDGCHGLGCSLKWLPSSWSLERPSSGVEYKSPRDAGRINNTEILSSSVERSPCASCVRQHSDGLIYQPPGRITFTPPVQAGATNPSLGRGKVLVSECILHSGQPECRGRHPVEAGAENRGLEAPSTSSGVHIAEVRTSGSGCVRLRGDNTLAAVVRPHSSCTIGAGRHGAHMAEVTSICFPADRSAPTSSSESLPRPSMSAASSTILASSNMVLGENFPARWHSLGDSHPQGSTVSSWRADLSPSARTIETVGLAPEGHQLIDSGLQLRL
ncbi:uncharacterized protein LOC108280255 [Ictalurus punctatus]|uniref:Uncharacterized protein LOC108280255 n=1 Tax=Ictalurus punctatus TaxID=7998 RepID=A0A9F7QNQ5_ICTPU|nr:uncharacterized protein LOC108280255 [Ictalurus punctatus]XP_053529760.1 uncharacterized protein LOC108280255 [Ictalurus punctatus]